MKDMQEQRFDYPQINMKSTGQLLRFISKRKKITVREIQTALGLASNQAIYDWFNGKTLPTLNNFYALSKLFKVPMEGMIVPAGASAEDMMIKIFKEDKQLIRIMEYRKHWKKSA